MKIDNNRPNFDAAPVGTVEAAKSADVKAAAIKTASSGTDQVSVSADAKLAGAAIDAAHRTPDVRADLVERAKTLLNEGKVGDDPYRLADALIDKAIDTNE